MAEFQILVGVCTAPSSYHAEARSPHHRHTDQELGTVEVQVLAQSSHVCATSCLAHLIPWCSTEGSSGNPNLQLPKFAVTQIMQ